MLVVAAFSLRELPGPREAPLGPEAYRPADALSELRALAERHPRRRAGSSGDGALADDVAGELRRAARGMVIRRRVESGDTPDGRRRLVEVEATLPGPPGAELVVVAHRDSVRADARAELSGTAAMIELARAIGRGRPQRTVRFVSVSGGSGGGLAGATRVARRLDPARVRAVLVLGDLATPGPSGAPARGYVVPWSNDTGGMAPPVLQRTATLALRREGVTGVRTPLLGAQVVRQALPATTGEQGEFLQAGVPAVTLTGVRTTPETGTAVSAARMAGFGRAALRIVQALDPPGAQVGTPRTRLEVLGRELPLWVLRLALLVVLAPALVALVLVGRGLLGPIPVGAWSRGGSGPSQRSSVTERQGGALTEGAGGLWRRARGRPGPRAYRDRSLDRPRRLATGLAWPIAAALPPLVTAAVAVAMARTGLLATAPAGPYDGAALRPGLVGWSLLVALALVAVLTAVGGRPAALRAVTDDERQARPDDGALAWGLAAILLPLAAVLFVLVPLAAVLVLPAALAWPLAVSGDPPLPMTVRRGLVGLGAAVPLLAVGAVAWSLGVGVLDVPWWATLLVAGGHLPPLGVLAFCLVLGAGTAAVARVLPPRRRRATTGSARPAAPDREAAAAPEEAPAPRRPGRDGDDDGQDEWAWEDPAPRPRRAVAARTETVRDDHHPERAP